MQASSRRFISLLLPGRATRRAPDTTILPRLARPAPVAGHIQHRRLPHLAALRAKPVRHQLIPAQRAEILAKSARPPTESTPPERAVRRSRKDRGVYSQPDREWAQRQIRHLHTENRGLNFPRLFNRRNCRHVGAIRASHGATGPARLPHPSMKNIGFGLFVERRLRIKNRSDDAPSRNALSLPLGFVRVVQPVLHRSVNEEKSRSNGSDVRAVVARKCLGE